MTGPAGWTSVTVDRVSAGGEARDTDRVALEEPLEIRVVHSAGGRVETAPVSVTMRTPGEDRELAVGFLFSEGLLRSAADVDGFGPEGSALEPCNVVTVRLSRNTPFDAEKLRRHFYATSSCGVCGKASLEALSVRGLRPVRSDAPSVDEAVVPSLPGRLREAQAVFEATGGLHAAALFEPDGTVRSVHEDVGRHNAVDKAIGRELLEKRVPLTSSILFVSGRTSFEILQKAVAAGVPVVAAVSAPSSLAVDLARRFGVTLLGFVRDGRFNVYSGEERLRRSSGAA